jgi:hypothetical protein
MKSTAIGRYQNDSPPGTKDGNTTMMLVRFPMSRITQPFPIPAIPQCAETLPETPRTAALKTVARADWPGGSANIDLYPDNVLRLR